MASRICALSPDRQELWRFRLEEGRWLQYDKTYHVAYEHIYGGRFGLFITSQLPYAGLPAGHLRGRFENYSDIGPHGWIPIGYPGATFAVTGDSVFGLTPDRSAVFQFKRTMHQWESGDENRWIQVGNAASWLYGGVYGLFATHPTSGDIFRYMGTPQTWERIGLPGANFAVTSNTIYGLTGDRQRVYRYNGWGDSWMQIGGPAAEIYGGEWGLVATDPTSGNLWHYREGTNDWEEIGGPGAQFAVTRNTVYGLTPDKQGVFRYDGTPFSWSGVGGPADSIYAYEDVH